MEIDIISYGDLDEEFDKIAETLYDLKKEFLKEY